MRNYGYGKPRSKKIGKYKVEIEFHDFKKARININKGNKQVYYGTTDILSNNKERTLTRYRDLKNVKTIESFVKKRNAIK